MKGKSKAYNTGRNAAFHLKDFKPYESTDWIEGYNSFLESGINIFDREEKDPANIQQQLQPENGPVECHHNSCAGWKDDKCSNPGMCREGAVSG